MYETQLTAVFEKLALLTSIGFDLSTQIGWHYIIPRDSPWTLDLPLEQIKESLGSVGIV